MTPEERAAAVYRNATGPIAINRYACASLEAEIADAIRAAVEEARAEPPPATPGAIALELAERLPLRRMRTVYNEYLDAGRDFPEADFRDWLAGHVEAAIRRALDAEREAIAEKIEGEGGKLLTEYARRGAVFLAEIVRRRKEPS